MSCGNLGGTLILPFPPSSQGCNVDILVVHCKPYTESGIGGHGVPFTPPPPIVVVVGNLPHLASQVVL